MKLPKVLGLILLSCAAFPVFAQADGSEARELELRLLELVNIEREKQSLRPLIWHEALSGAARAHSEDMMLNNNFSHTGTDGSSPSQRAARVGVTGGVSENIGAGYRTPEAAVSDWMRSDGHRANILSANSTHLGAGFVRRTPGSGATYETYWTLKFARVTTSALPHARAPVTNAGAAGVYLRNRTLTVAAPPHGAAARVRLIDTRGKQTAEFTADGAARFSLANIPAGRYVVEVRDTGGRRRSARGCVTRISATW